MKYKIIYLLFAVIAKIDSTDKYSKMQVSQVWVNTLSK